MTKLWLIGAAAVTLTFAGPAAAANNSGYETGGHYGHYGEVTHRMRAQDFNHFDFGIARPTYHSGWGGPYGDGDYPGTVDQNLGPPYWGSR